MRDERGHTRAMDGKYNVKITNTKTKNNRWAFIAGVDIKEAQKFIDKHIDSDKYVYELVKVC